MGARQNDLKENAVAVGARPAVLEDRVLLISRELDCNAATLFQLWTDPEYLMRWWGPHDFTTSFCEIDLRQGGHYRFCISSPQGRQYWMAGTYREVQESRRLVFSFAWEEKEPEDQQQNGKRGAETLVTVTFAEQAGKTRLTFRQAFFSSVEARDSHHDGWSECLDKLAVQLSRTTI